MTSELRLPGQGGGGILIISDGSAVLVVKASMGVHLNREEASTQGFNNDSQGLGMASASESLVSW